MPSSDKIYILCYIPLSQVKHKTIILVIFSTFVKQQLFPLINVVSVTYKFIFAKSQMCQNMLYIWKPIYLIYNDQKTKLHIVINIPVPSSDKIYILCYIPLSQALSSDHSSVPSLRYEVRCDPLPEHCFNKHRRNSCFAG